MVLMPKDQKPSPFAMEVEIIITWEGDLRNVCFSSDAIYRCRDIHFLTFMILFRRYVPPSIANILGTQIN
jgi:hypothetical protein